MIQHDSYLKSVIIDSKHIALFLIITTCASTADNPRDVCANVALVRRLYFSK